MTFYWFAVFEQFVSIPVPQPEGEPTSQMVAEAWNRSGTVNISPGRDTGSVVKEIETTCKAGDIPADALLINVVILPNRLAG